jgi:hypothetical protein
MRDGVIGTKKDTDVSVMFSDDASIFATDEELAIHVMHRFNIDRETLESMPAFKDPLNLLLWAKDE